MTSVELRRFPRRVQGITPFVMGIAMELPRQRQERLGADSCIFHFELKQRKG
jgi:hypothetical protein